MTEQTLVPLLDQDTTLTGTARDAHLGAVLLLEDRTPVYIDGLSSWDDQHHGKEVSITGTLRRHSIAPQATVSQDGGVSHGVEGQNYVLFGAAWNLIQGK